MTQLEVIVFIVVASIGAHIIIVGSAVVRQDWGTATFYTVMLAAWVLVWLYFRDHVRGLRP